MQFLSYLSHSPCVVANLWDVTDRDIDRFLEYLLKAWLATSTKSPPTSDNQSLAGLLNDARKTCKLKHLIGFAPVLYGLPAIMLEGWSYDQLYSSQSANHNSFQMKIIWGYYIFMCTYHEDAICVIFRAASPRIWIKSILFLINL